MDDEPWDLLELITRLHCERPALFFYIRGTLRHLLEIPDQDKGPANPKPN